MVKPILKKRSHSEKNSLDLDRPLEEQHVPGLAVLTSGYEPGSQARFARDVSFSSYNDNSVAYASKPRYQHARSHSGTSHVSIATTASGGGSRPSTFIHPFQQTPRTQTPPLTFTNPAASLDNGIAYTNTGNGSIRDYSPTITENDDDDDYPVGSLPTHRYHHGHTASLSQSSLRHPTLVNQRAASFSDINAAPPLRLNTARSMPSGRRGPGNSSLSSSLSHSDLHLHTSAGSAVIDSPSCAGPVAPAPLSSSSYAPLSPLRSSLEGVGFPRLRSRSEVDSGVRADQIREARRKFEERERAKAEKHDREMVRKRERRDHKEAKSHERQQAAQLRKNSSSGASDTIRPSLSRKSTPTFGSNSGMASGSDEKGRESGRFSRQAAQDASEKPLAFKSNNYNNVAGGQTPSFGPTVDSVAFKNARRNNTTKRKTQGYWNGFVLWLRTRLFHMGRN
ncbi:hypothetical protein SCUCBS95973_003684 [Sporothrix curviconia]|uniref:Pal1 cell morphology protein n=1 Tax=Sporothrix curviconia TaxID=1260050 RepID=A0ABP0BHE8_9PEZI